MRLRHLGVLSASLSPPFRLTSLRDGVRVASLACVCARSVSPPPRGSGFGSPPSPRLGCVTGVCVCVPLGSPSLSSLSRRVLSNNALTGTVPEAVCNLVVIGDLDYCYLGGNQLTFPPPFCASKCDKSP